jgi:hypothetical protein
MRTVHVVEFGFELQTQLHFFLVIFGVLQVVLFKFQTHLLFICPFTFNLFAKPLQSVIIIPQNFLVISLFKKFLLVISFQSLNLSFLIARYFTYQHLVVSAATILQQNGEHFPHISD